MPHALFPLWEGTSSQSWGLCFPLLSYSLPSRLTRCSSEPHPDLSTIPYSVCQCLPLPLPGWTLLSGMYQVLLSPHTTSPFTSISEPPPFSAQSQHPISLLGAAVPLLLQSSLVRLLTINPFPTPGVCVCDWSCPTFLPLVPGTGSCSPISFALPSRDVSCFGILKAQANDHTPSSIHLALFFFIWDFQPLTKPGSSGVSIAQYLLTLTTASMTPCPPDKGPDSAPSQQEEATGD
ncbi:hypothetical protein H1C71_020946 [Ictidomys tridecemlineatus]|nr:hypothetical protein H1C71_020946 [Ictidomys tridecemlineatus]